MAETHITVNIEQSCDSDSCSMEWNIVDSDNNDPECYLAGTQYYARLQKFPDTLDPCVFGTNAYIYFDSTQSESIADEYITFSGDQIQNAANPIYGDFSYEIIGDIYDASCNVLPAVTFTINIGSSQITANIPCYAVIKINYTTTYDRYRFSGKSNGQGILAAIASCAASNSTVDATTDIEFVSDCTEADACLNITLAIDTESEEGSNADNLGDKIIRVYGANQNQISVAISNGSLVFQGQKQEQVTDVANVCNGNFSASKYVFQIISQQAMSGNLNTFVAEAGQLRMLTNPSDSAVSGIPSGNGTLSITYWTQFLEYRINAGGLAGYGVFIVQDNTQDDCDPHCLGYELGAPEADEELYDITLVYRDFVTGAPIPEAQVWVDGKYIGQTDANGEILVEGLVAKKKHLVKASRPGYLNTDSDSLANDSFIIQA